MVMVTGEKKYARYSLGADDRDSNKPAGNA
jgi:hypothetical protein